MSSCEAELVALADTAIELLHVSEVVTFFGVDALSDPIEVCTDSKAAYDLSPMPPFHHRAELAPRRSQAIQDA